MLILASSFIDQADWGKLVTQNLFKAQDHNDFKRIWVFLLLVHLDLTFFFNPKKKPNNWVVVIFGLLSGNKLIAQLPLLLKIGSKDTRGEEKIERLLSSQSRASHYGQNFNISSKKYKTLLILNKWNYIISLQN